MGSWDTDLSLYVCRASVCTAELSFQPGGILCSNQIVTPATNNLISKDSSVLLLTLQNLLYSLEADMFFVLSCSPVGSSTLYLVSDSFLEAEKC